MGRKDDLPYANHPARLADVMALIQVLALHRAGDRSGGGLQSEMQGAPRSATSWDEVAKEHPEFFRVNPDTKLGVSLVSRHALPTDEQGRRVRLSPEFTTMLLRTAVDLHDRQVHRAEEWKAWLGILQAVTGPIVAGIMGLVVGLLLK